MNLPKNVLWFQILLYLSLGLDALSVAFQDRTPTATITESTIAVATVTAACLILFLVFLVWLAAERRKSWPRSVLTVALALSVITLLPTIAARGLQFDSAVEALSCALTAAGLYCSYTGDAKGWFNA